MVKVSGVKVKKGIKSQTLGENHGILGKIFGTEQVKRTASERSPSKDGPSKKRSAFGDITNAAQTIQIGKNKKAKSRSSKETKSTDVRKTKSKAGPVVADSRENDAIPELELLSSSSEITSSQEPSEYGASQEQKDTEIEMDAIEETEEKEQSMEEGECNSSTKGVQVIPDDVKDIDEDMSDPFMVSEYAYEIFQNMKARENLFPLKPYMDDQKELSVSMRAILVDWLVEVQESFELYHETLYVGVRILDHFLMKCPNIKREDLQLVGAVSLFIAAKVEERHSPCLDDFLYICDDAYQHKAFVAMERRMLAALEFELNIPIPYRFLRRYAKAASANIQTLTLARFLLESTLQNYQFLEYKPSLLASSCLYLALQMKKCGTWSPTMVYYTGYQLEELKECVLKLNAMNSEPPKKNLMTVRNKYSHKVFHEVALIPPVDMLLLDFK